MNRRLAVGLAAVVVLVLGLIVLSRWLQGPRAAVPQASRPAVSPVSPATAPPPTRTTVGLPDPALTPGSVNPNVTEENLDSTVCLRGWTATVRPPSAYTSALKLAQILEYGYADRSPSHYQEDHLVALEIGGAARDPRNLWPEPNDVRLPDGTSVGSSEKDGLEDYLHAAVCARAIPLAEAQRAMASDWIAAWESAGRP
jgi:hypothetical protein